MTSPGPAHRSVFTIDEMARWKPVETLATSASIGKTLLDQMVQLEWKRGQVDLSPFSCPMAAWIYPQRLTGKRSVNGYIFSNLQSSLRPLI